MPDLARIAAEFGLGEPVTAASLAGGRAGVVRLTTARGTFVLKPAYATEDVRLSEQVAVTLTAAGIRQARLLRTRAGSLVSQSGHTVREFLPGEISGQPTAAQTAAAMRHLGGYQRALDLVPAPAGLGAPATVWDRVASADYLVAELPGLLREYGPSEHAGDGRVAAALGQVDLARPGMRQLPHQLVHGDIGPDNVLMDGDDVVAIIDFTPHLQPVLFAVATAVYWYHVYGQPRLDPGAMGASFAAAAPRAWTATERELWPAMLAREALRRLATPFAVAAESGSAPTAWPTALRVRAEAHGLLAAAPSGLAGAREWRHAVAASSRGARGRAVARRPADHGRRDADPARTGRRGSRPSGRPGR